MYILFLGKKYRSLWISLSTSSYHGNWKSSVGYSDSLIRCGSCALVKRESVSQNILHNFALQTRRVNAEVVEIFFYTLIALGL